MSARPQATARGRWLLLVPAFVSLVLLSDLVLSAAARQWRLALNAREALEAVLHQEPYRRTEWGRRYWEELARYRERWRPYYVYRVGEMRGDFINVVDGVRRTHQPVLAADHRHTVFVFGGSAAWGYGSRDAETIPSWLARGAERVGEHLEVHNYAESGWVNWQGVVFLLERLAAGQRPDLVLFLSGANEVLAGRDWPHVRYPLLQAESYPVALGEWAMARARPLARVWDYYRRTSLTVTSLFPPPARMPAAPAPDTSRIVDRIAVDYLAARETVQSLGRAYGFSVVFVWQPTVVHKTRLTAQEQQYAGWLPASSTLPEAVAWWRLDQPTASLYRAVERRVAQAGVVILPDVFDGMSEPAFIDWVHPTEAASERIGTALVEMLVPALHTRRATAVD